MGYDIALAESWLELERATRENKLSVNFLKDEYSVDLENKRILSLSCNVPAKDYISILILHYLTKKIMGVPEISGEWISFKQFPGGEGYFPAFKKRVIDVILRKYGKNPENLLNLVERFNAKKAQLSDVSVVLEPFDKVPLLITLSRADDEFGPEANLLFDKVIEDIFCTEDIVVLSEFIAHSI